MQRSLERLVAIAPVAAWVKLEDGRLQAFSRSLARGLGVAVNAAGRVSDEDFFSPSEIRRFREHDRRVLDLRRPIVFIEPPDTLTPAAWGATLKIPLLGPACATAGFSLSVDTLPLLEGFLDAVQGQAPAPEHPPLATRVSSRLDRSFRGRVQVSRLASELRRHPDHMAKRFRQDFGMTVARYVKARRVAWAARRLADAGEGYSLAEIALDAGFYDQSHLTHAFQAILGTTPGKYRCSRAAPRPFRRLTASSSADPTATLSKALYASWVTVQQASDNDSP